MRATHGRLGYLKGCRCDVCREGNRLAMAHRRKLQAMRLPTSRLVDATGTARRLQALACIGYSGERIGRRLGLPRQTVNRLLNGTFQRVALDTAEQIAKLYDELWDKPLPRSQSASIARNLARRRGWFPPMAWDDDTIDEPLASPTGLPVERVYCPLCAARPGEKCININNRERYPHPEREAAA